MKDIINENKNPTKIVSKNEIDDSLCIPERKAFEKE